MVEVKSTNGDTHLGGDNIDQRIIDWLIQEFKRDQGIDVSKDQMALQRLKDVYKRQASAWSAKWQSGRQLRIRRTRFIRSSALWGGASTR